MLGMVVQQGLTLAGAGILAGLSGAIALTRVMTSLLFGVSALDAVTFFRSSDTRACCFRRDRDSGAPRHPSGSRRRAAPGLSI